jgi:hypothetical protein
LLSMSVSADSFWSSPIMLPSPRHQLSHITYNSQHLHTTPPPSSMRQHYGSSIFKISSNTSKSINTILCSKDIHCIIYWYGLVEGRDCWQVRWRAISLLESLSIVWIHLLLHRMHNVCNIHAIWCLDYVVSKEIMDM